MSRFDERLTKELERAATPAEPTDVFEEIDRRRGRRVAVRRVQTALLATVVFAGSVGGVLVLNRAFRGEGATTTPALPPAQNGLIVVSFGDDGGTHLYLQDPDDASWNPRDHQLTDSNPNPDVIHRDTNPALSPDGRTVAFERAEVSVSSTTTSVWTIGTDGSGLRRVLSADLHGGQPAWSPDGTRIAYRGLSMDAPGIFVVNADGSGDRALGDGDGPLANAIDPAWSPDGTKIAVAVPDGSDTSSIASIDVETGESTAISPAFWDAGSPSWSPDGRRLTFAHGGGVVVFTLDGGDIRELTPTHTAEEAASADLAYVDSEPTWSPDGAWIAFQRSSGPSETFVYAVRPDGTDLHRIGLGGDPAWGPAPIQTDPSPTDPSEPTEGPVSQDPGRDIGLEFNLCRLEALHGIDFLGDGAAGTAWVGGRLTADGSCSDEYLGDSVVAVDVDGDGRAESWAALTHCVGCAPFSFTDLNGDGTQELVVTLQFSATTEYTVYSLQPAPGGGPPLLEEVRIAEPGAPPFLRPDRPLTFWSGGDAGFTAWVDCEGYPQNPVLVITETERPIEGPGSDVRQVDTARLVIRTDGTAEVIGSDSYTEPATYASNASTGRACGLELWPA